MGPKLERYEVIDELGQGGMSVVYRARDKQLGREVALKVLHEHLARQPEARRRLHREAVAVAKLHHRGIVEIFDYSGPDATDAYIVTELIDGVTLRRFVELHGRPAFPELGALVTLELVRALRHAHEQGIIHRDLKPENVMVAKDGQLKLMDFGIAQIMGGQTKLTMTGTLLGSPAHMAPEVIDGQPPDHRADIFSMGTILYWLTTGELPFQAPNPSALFRRILEGQREPPQARDSRIGLRLSRIVERALVSAPEERHQDVSELEEELREDLESVGIDTSEAAVRAYLRAPVQTAQALEPALLGNLVRSGREALAASDVARAMDRFNRVLAWEPNNAEVRSIVSSVGRRQRLTRAATRGARAAVVIAILSTVAWAGSKVVGSVGSATDERIASSGESVEPRPSDAKDPTRLPAIPDRVAAAKTGSSSPIATASTSSDEAPMAARSPERDRTPRDRPLERIRRAVESARRRGAGSPPPGATANETGSQGVDDPKAEPAPLTATLEIAIGPSYADVIIDGAVAKSDAYRGAFTLARGRHTVEIVKPGVGRYAPRVVEVDSEGRIFELKAEQRLPILGVLRFRVPSTKEDALVNPILGWTST